METGVILPAKGRLHSEFCGLVRGCKNAGATKASKELLLALLLLLLLLPSLPVLQLLLLLLLLLLVADCCRCGLLFAVCCGLDCWIADCRSAISRG
ncbi:rCG22866, isoform CRA_b [Rattus norvegicus]|uniref:RCG22866, isoform CRA_b n=1 Tax=Rattus norvegicus TaxID=10116 RepID=A6KPA3_RAT|nr:rCG22866, isoform CRA_b [Rattus norvegicus]